MEARCVRVRQRGSGACFTRMRGRGCCHIKCIPVCECATTAVPRRDASAARVQGLSAARSGGCCSLVCSRRGRDRRPMWSRRQSRRQSRRHPRRPSLVNKFASKRTGAFAVLCGKLLARVRRRGASSWQVRPSLCPSKRSRASCGIGRAPRARRRRARSDRRRPRRPVRPISFIRFCSTCVSFPTSFLRGPNGGVRTTPAAHECTHRRAQTHTQHTRTHTHAHTHAHTHTHARARLRSTHAHPHARAALAGVAQGPRARLPDLVRAEPGVYVDGAPGSNECPTDCLRIESEAVCERAAAAMGRRYVSSSSEATWPRGCYVSTTGNTYRPPPVSRLASSSRFARCSPLLYIPSRAASPRESCRHIRPALGAQVWHSLR
jgi:hypothetical protein